MLRTIIHTLVIAAWVCPTEAAVLSMRQKPIKSNNSTTFQFGSTGTPMRGVNAGGWYVPPSMFQLQAKQTGWY